ncbi:Cell shape-determining protein MreC [bacterium HR15]|nr:Cell shape-determining protein MreC [bacterium HR15]
MSRRHLWSLALLASAGLTLGVYHNHRTHGGQSNPLTALVRTTVVPVQDALHRFWDGVSGQMGAIAHARQTVREHERLVEENARLRLQLSQMEQIQQEHAEMARLLQLRSKVPGEWLGCRVIASYPQAGQQSLIIDRGTRDGIQPGAPVVANDGLVGVVVQADTGHAIVRFITAPRIAVSAKVLNAQKIATGICEGNGESTLLLNFLPPEAPLQTGDRIVTAGLGGKYPPNIPIGTVERVWIDHQYSVKKATVQPAVDFGTLQIVLVHQQRQGAKH